MPTTKATIAFILKGYPRVSETFIAREIAALESAGLSVHIYSLRHPTERIRHAVHDKVRAAVTYLPEYLHREPWRVWRAWRYSRQLCGYKNACRAFLRDVQRDRSRNRLRRFGQALVLATELAPGIHALHAHFLHTPASVARYASLLRALPWSGSAHAKDIWTQENWEIREKLTSCSWLVTCTKYNHQHLSTMQARAGQVSLVYHGLNLAQFAPPPSGDHGASDDDVATGDIKNTTGRGALHILSVGRAVPKKGYDVLLDALAILHRTPEAGDVDWSFEHIGGGPQSAMLQRKARQLGIQARIRWRGAQAEEEVLAAYRRADLFVLASRVSDDGDRDGLPNVLLEAQSQGVACIATRISGIPELICSGKTGLLVEQNDAASLTEAMRHLLKDRATRCTLAKAGQQRVQNEFDMQRATNILLSKFRDGYRTTAHHKAAMHPEHAEHAHSKGAL